MEKTLLKSSACAMMLKHRAPPANRSHQRARPEHENKTET
jgi:hypothetical protein